MPVQRVNYQISIVCFGISHIFQTIFQYNLLLIWFKTGHKYSKLSSDCYSCKFVKKCLVTVIYVKTITIITFNGKFETSRTFQNTSCFVLLPVCRKNIATMVTKGPTNENTTVFSNAIMHPTASFHLKLFSNSVITDLVGSFSFKMLMHFCKLSYLWACTGISRKYLMHTRYKVNCGCQTC